MSSVGEHEPNELEAWKIMMDSMIKFIAASTKLMNTINDKAERSSVISVIPSECEEECLICPSRSPKDCGTCAILKSQKDKDKGKKACTGVCNSAEPAGTAAIPGADAAPEANVESKLEDIAEAAEEAPAEEGSAEDAPAEEAPAEEAPAEEAPAEEAPAEEVSAVEAPAEDKAANEGETEQPKADGDKDKSKYCTCEELRIIKKQARLAGVDVGGKGKGGCKGKHRGPPPEGGCSCKSGKNSDGQTCRCGDDVPDGESSMCTCDVGPKEKTRMTNELADKLNNAHEEIVRLQQEMGRLQRLELNKQTNSAALYKEIMKDGPPLGSKSCGQGGPSTSMRPGEASNMSYSAFGAPAGNSTIINGTNGCPSQSSYRSPRSFMATHRSEGPSMPNTMDYSNTSSNCGTSKCPYKKGSKLEFGALDGSYSPYSHPGQGMNVSERVPGFRSMANTASPSGGVGCGNILGFASLDSGGQDSSSFGGVGCPNGFASLDSGGQDSTFRSGGYGHTSSSYRTPPPYPGNYYNNMSNTPDSRAFQNSQAGCNASTCSNNSRGGPNATSTPNSSSQNMTGQESFDYKGCFYQVRDHQ